MSDQGVVAMIVTSYLIDWPLMSPIITPCSNYQVNQTNLCLELTQAP